VGNRAGSTPAPGTKTSSFEEVFLVLGSFENLIFLAKALIDKLIQLSAATILIFPKYDL
jgi:hypothetical protein